MERDVVVVIDNGIEKITYTCKQPDADRLTGLLERAIGPGTRETLK